MSTEVPLYYISREFCHEVNEANVSRPLTSMGLFQGFDTHTHTQEVCPENIQPRNMKNVDIYSVPFKVSTLGPHTVLPIAIGCHILFS